MKSYLIFLALIACQLIHAQTYNNSHYGKGDIINGDKNENIYLGTDTTSQIGKYYQSNPNECTKTTGNYCFTNKGRVALQFRLPNSIGDVVVEAGQSGCINDLQEGNYSIEVFKKASDVPEYLQWGNAFTDHYRSLQILVIKCKTGASTVY